MKMSLAQIQKVDQFNTWYTYSGNNKINAKYSVHTLYSFRRNGIIENWQQSLVRVGLNYKANDKLTITPGYDWALTFPYGEQSIATKTNDHRVFEQFLLKNKVGRLNISNKYRFEQRFIGYSSNYVFRKRFRYRLTTVIPINQKEMGDNTLFIKFFDELFINYGKGVGNHYFDQNWLYAGVGYKFNNNTSISVGYMNQYFVKGDNIRVENNHTLSFSLSHNLNLSIHDK